MKTFVVTGALILFTSGLAAQEITSFSGFWGTEFYQDKEKLSWKEINEIMTQNQDAEIYWQKSKKQMLATLAVGTVNLGSAIWFVVNEMDDKPVTAPLVAFAGTGLIGSIIYYSASKNKKKAILEYNDSLGKKVSFHLVPTSNENGVGLALKF
ncbi:hypothetical protein K8352_07325 [Flavobacteriaceae bacterium F89]|uniref:Uncharacterized protein n=1 Tax=Cerina litoralis TaxID=2874477 RepID=A0AAE3ET99_9FLAO|nr:hypothetical protein [Cerina litoralis]MCG2460553.1 hypothetical protein [Cerina litoralis]